MHPSIQQIFLLPSLALFVARARARDERVAAKKLAFSERALLLLIRRRQRRRRLYNRKLMKACSARLGLLSSY